MGAPVWGVGDREEVCVDVFVWISRVWWGWQLLSFVPFLVLSALVQMPFDCCHGSGWVIRKGLLRESWESN